MKLGKLCIHSVGQKWETEIEGDVKQIELNGRKLMDMHRVGNMLKWLSIFLVFQSIGMACLVVYGFSDKKTRDAQADRIDKKVHYMISVTPETRAERPYSDFMYDPSVITVIKDVKELVNKTSTSH